MQPDTPKKTLSPTGRVITGIFLFIMALILLSDLIFQWSDATEGSWLVELLVGSILFATSIAFFVQASKQRKGTLFPSIVTPAMATPSLPVTKETNTFGIVTLIFTSVLFTSALILLIATIVSPGDDNRYGLFVGLIFFLLVVGFSFSIVAIQHKIDRTFGIISLVLSVLTILAVVAARVAIVAFEYQNALY